MRDIGGPELAAPKLPVGSAPRPWVEATQQPAYAAYAGWRNSGRWRRGAGLTRCGSPLRAPFVQAIGRQPRRAPNAFEGMYGDYLLGQGRRLFPDLRRALNLPGRQRLLIPDERSQVRTVTYCTDIKRTPKSTPPHDPATLSLSERCTTALHARAFGRWSARGLMGWTRSASTQTFNTPTCVTVPT